MKIPSAVLPDIRLPPDIKLPAPAPVPPMVLFVPPTPMPADWFPRPGVPAASVPISLSATRLPSDFKAIPSFWKRSIRKPLMVLDPTHRLQIPRLPRPAFSSVDLDHRNGRLRIESWLGGGVDDNRIDDERQAREQVDRVHARARDVEVDRVGAGDAVGEVDRLAQAGAGADGRIGGAVVLIDRRGDNDAVADLVRADVGGGVAREAALVGRGDARTAGSPALIAGLPASRAMVWVGPPLLGRGPSQSATDHDVAVERRSSRRAAGADQVVAAA